jgi:hypothetical protein
MAFMLGLVLICWDAIARPTPPPRFAKPSDSSNRAADCAWLVAYSDIFNNVDSVKSFFLFFCTPFLHTSPFTPESGLVSFL